MAVRGSLHARDRRWPVRVAVTIAAVVAVGAVAVLCVAVVPRAIANMNTEVVTTTVTETVGAVTVAAGPQWAVQRPPFAGETIVLLSPDRTLSITVEEVDAAPAAALETVAGDTSDAVAEPLASGLLAAHAQRGADTIVAAVGPDGGTRCAVLTAVAADGDIAPYLATIAGVLESVAVAG